MAKNRVMSAKRVTGPSPNTMLSIAVQCETCDRKACDKPPLVTASTDGKVQRFCIDHLTSTRKLSKAELEWLRVNASY